MKGMIGGAIAGFIVGAFGTAYFLNVIHYPDLLSGLGLIFVCAGALAYLGFTRIPW
jgi:hypothetical protein